MGGVTFALKREIVLKKLSYNRSESDNEYFLYTRHAYGVAPKFCGRGSNILSHVVILN